MTGDVLKIGPIRTRDVPNGNPISIFNLVDNTIPVNALLARLAEFRAGLVPVLSPFRFAHRAL